MANGTNGKAQVLADLVTSASGVIVVVVALTALGFMTSYIVSALDSQDAKLAVATTALGVIGAIVGAFFGVKVAGDSSKSAQEQTQATTDKLVATTDKLVAVAHASDPKDPGVKAALGL
jgi:hypothetical protein